MEWVWRVDGEGVEGRWRGWGGGEDGWRGWMERIDGEGGEGGWRGCGG